MSTMLGVSVITIVLGIAVLLKAFLSFLRPQKVLAQTEDFSKEELIRYMNSYFKRNIYYALTGFILIFVSSIIMIILR